MNYTEQVVFDSYGSTVIADNSEDVQILSEEDIFTDKIDPIIYNWVATICGKYLFPKMIGIVIWSWTYDEVQMHIKMFNNVIYFTESPVNMLSVTALYESTKDDEVT